MRFSRDEWVTLRTCAVGASRKDLVEKIDEVLAEMDCSWPNDPPGTKKVGSLLGLPITSNPDFLPAWPAVAKRFRIRGLTTDQDEPGVFCVRLELAARVFEVSDE